MLEKLRRLKRRLPLTRLTSPRGSDVVHFNGLALRYRPEDWDVAGEILRTGTYGHETTTAVKELLRPGMTFVDAGAHIGYYSVLAAKFVGATGHVYCFEPIPATNAMLRANVELNGFSSQTTIESLAISSRRASLAFVIDEASSVASRMATSSEAGVPLDATSLDDYFAARGWPDVHVVKMDIEGAELEGFRGMTELVRRNATMAVIFEVHLEVLGRQGESVHSLFDELVHMNFSRFSILRDGMEDFHMPEDVERLAQLPADTVVNVLAQGAA